MPLLICHYTGSDIHGATSYTIGVLLSIRIPPGTHRTLIIYNMEPISKRLTNVTPAKADVCNVLKIHDPGFR